MELPKFLFSFQFDHQNELRPTLGHPNQVAVLSALCDQEEQRRAENLEGVEQHTQTLRELVVQNSKEFIENLAKMAENLLVQFDNLLVIDEVEKGRKSISKRIFKCCRVKYRNMPNKGAGRDSKVQSDDMVKAEVL